MLDNNSHARTHIGRKRKVNQDFVTFFTPKDAEALSRSGQLFIVADGVGGGSRGDVASKFASQKVLYEYYRIAGLDIGERLNKAMRQANIELVNFAKSNENYHRVATTMVAAILRKGLLTVANVGDSRAYLIRGGEPTQITRDHSLVGELVEMGEMTEEIAMKSSLKNRITRSLGGDPDLDVDVYPAIKLKPGDKVLLCSDGMHQYANRAQVAKLVERGTPEEITDRLIKHANKSGGSDNISVIVIEIPGDEISIDRDPLEYAETEGLMDSLPIPFEIEPGERDAPRILDEAITPNLDFFLHDDPPKSSRNPIFLWIKRAALAIFVILLVVGVIWLGTYLMNNLNRIADEVRSENATATALANPNLLPATQTPEPVEPTNLNLNSPLDPISSLPSPGAVQEFIVQSHSTVNDNLVGGNFLKRTTRW